MEVKDDRGLSNLPSSFSQAPPKLIKPGLFNKQLPTNCGPVLIAQSSLLKRTQFFVFSCI